jgi:hypothetical protein
MAFLSTQNKLKESFFHGIRPLRKNGIVIRNTVERAVAAGGGKVTLEPMVTPLIPYQGLSMESLFFLFNVAYNIPILLNHHVSHFPQKATLMLEKL